MTGIANYARGAILDALFNGVALQVPARYIKLHVGDPGADCVLNPAANTLRALLSNAASVGGVITNGSAIAWTNVPAAETYSHASIWDDITGGNALWSGLLSTPTAVNVGDNFSIPVGALTAALA